MTSPIARNLVATLGTAMLCVLLIHMNPSAYLSVVLLLIAGGVPALIQRQQSWVWVLALSVLVFTGTYISTPFFQLHPNENPYQRFFVVMLSPMLLFLGGLLSWFVLKNR